MGQGSLEEWINCLWAHKSGSNKPIPTASAIVKILYGINLGCFP